MRRVPEGRHNASWYVSGRVMSDQTEHSRAIIVGYVPSGHYFRSLFPGRYFLVAISWSLFPVHHFPARAD